MDWYLVPCLATLRDEINRLAPNRDRTSDGSVGDLVHQQEPSDHNPDSAGRVHAIDVDNTGPWPPAWSAERIVQLLLDRQRAGQDDRLQNIIYNRRIWSRSWGWTVRTYTGASPHTEHIHLSARHDETRTHTQPWGLLAAYQQEDTVISPDDRKDIARELLGTNLGANGPTVGVALQSSFALLQALTVMAKAEAAEVPPSVTQIVDGVQAAFDTSSPEDTAALLRAVLGDQAATVGRLLAGA